MQELETTEKKKNQSTMSMLDFNQLHSITTQAHEMVNRISGPEL